MTWTCPSCGETHEDTFDACWKCGTSKSGVRDASFVRDQDLVIDRSSIEEEMLRRFKCERCGGRTARAKRIATTGTGLSRLLDLQHIRFIALSCHTCARVEMFDLAMLEGSDRAIDMLDLLFGP